MILNENENITLRRGKNFEYFVFDVFKLLLVVGRIHDQLVLHFLQFGFLLSGENAKKLILVWLKFYKFKLLITGLKNYMARGLKLKT